ncbi:YciI family protein, partial [Streptomyces rubiginosohelvolus]|uniref:YciI family protein n=1 Tax=Streptomyces rubiginosohelvolus TaxID=67362 RepID=UPI00367695BE
PLLPNPPLSRRGVWGAPGPGAGRAGGGGGRGPPPPPRPVVSDGPYSETKELLAGFWILDCESLERVTEIAARVARCPQPAGAPEYPVLIRPVDGGLDD